MNNCYNALYFPLKMENEKYMLDVIVEHTAGYSLDPLRQCSLFVERSKSDHNMEARREGIGEGWEGRRKG